MFGEFILFYFKASGKEFAVSEVKACEILVSDILLLSHAAFL